MTWLVALCIWCVLVAGTYLMLSRDILRCVIGLMLLGNGVNLLVLAAGRVGSPVTAVIRRVPAETPSSLRISKATTLLELSRCVPPQSSLLIDSPVLGPTDTIRTGSGYFSPKSIVAPAARASVIDMSSHSTAAR